MGKVCPRCKLPQIGVYECEYCGLKFNEYQKAPSSPTEKIETKENVGKIKKGVSSIIRIVGGLVIGIIILAFAMPLISKFPEASPGKIFAIVLIFYAALRNLFWSHPIISFFLIFCLAAIIYAALQKKSIELGTLQICPHCRETIDGKATVCKFCQRDVAEF